MKEDAVFAKREAVSEHQERCTKQSVQTVVRRLKYPSFHPATDLYTVRNATRNINQRDIN